jgi:hypothetical protein
MEAVKLPRELHGAIVCRECGTPLLFRVEDILTHPKTEPPVCALQSKIWKVEPPTVDAWELDEEPAA